MLTRGQHRASRCDYICVFIFSAESFTDIIIFYLLVCLSVRLLFYPAQDIFVRLHLSIIMLFISLGFVEL